MASLNSVRNKVVRTVVGAGAAGALALILVSPAQAQQYGCVQEPCSFNSIPTTPPSSPTTPGPTTTTTIGPEVEGENIEAVEPVVDAEQVSSDELPFTGVEVGGLVLLGGGLIAGGIALSVASRRRAHPES